MKQASRHTHVWRKGASDARAEAASLWAQVVLPRAAHGTPAADMRGRFANHAVAGSPAFHVGADVHNGTGKFVSHNDGYINNVGSIVVRIGTRSGRPLRANAIRVRSTTFMEPP